MSLTEALKWSIRVFRKLKVRFLISGGLAVKIYGAERHVSDIDIGISDSDMEKVALEMKKYIKYGPKRSAEHGFDEMLIKLDYKGQEIDVSGCDSRKIFNRKRNKWQNNRIKLADAEIKRFQGISVPVIKKESLIEYKNTVAREKDLIDVKNLEAVMD